MRRNVILAGASRPRGRPRRLRELPRSLLGARRRGGRGGGQQLSAQRLAQILSARGQGRQASTTRPPTSSPTSGWTTRCSARPWRGQAAGRLGEHRRGGVAGDLRAQGHALARHADGPRAARLATPRSTALYQSADVRVLQHILFGARAERPPRAREDRGQDKAEATLAQIRKGRQFRSARERALRGPGQQGRQRIPAAEPQGPVRAGVRQRGLDARARAGERTGRDARSATTSSSAHASDEARERVVGYLQERAAGAARLALHGQPGHRQQDRGGVGRAGRHARGVGGPRRAPELRPRRW